MATDLEIARQAHPRPIVEIADKAGFAAETLAPYGTLMAKVDASAYADRPLAGKLVLVTAITPTPAGEGKTTVSVALADGMRYNGKRAMLALREPSLGPVFGMKGGATGGGYAQVLPMENINLHFTGDLHAITAANNLLVALVDNHIHQGNALRIDPRSVCVRRCLDLNDRQLRELVTGLGGSKNGVLRESGFDITAASEVMATFCMASDLMDLRARLGRIVVGRDAEDKPVTVADVGANGAMTALLRDALSPNLVQSIDGTPCLMHGGPFANIAHGCNSVAATKLALRMSDYVVTEAGFGADLGAEKFIDLKCRAAGLAPACVTLVATVRALKHHGGVAKDALKTPDVEALRRGLPNLLRHIDNIQTVWRLPVVVAVNAFSSDSAEELAALQQEMRARGVPCALCEGWAKGGAGAAELARLVCEQADGHAAAPAFTYPDDATLEQKIEAVAKRVYRAGSVEYAPDAKKALAQLAKDGFSGLPVCIAKTQYSLSDDAKLLGAPEGYTLTIRNVRLSAGAGFAVAYAGSIIAMPGLPKAPAALSIDVDAQGNITGLF